MITESESEEEDEDGSREEEVVPSPVVRSKSWVEEEDEISEKGAVLLGPEEMEGEYAGEDLRRELLEAMVEHPPPRGIIDEFGMEDMNILETAVASSSPPPPSLVLAAVTTTTTTTTTDKLQPQRPAPHPYISRARSTSSNGTTGGELLQSPTNSISSSKRPTSP